MKKSNLEAKLARALVDYDNLRKRVERERAELEKRASLILAIRLVPVFDILGEAQKHLKDPALDLALKEFKEAFADNEIEQIEIKKGSHFDPDTQEAVETQKNGEKGTVKEVLLSGWRIKDGPVIRPAKVKVVN